MNITNLQNSKLLVNNRNGTHLFLFMCMTMVIAAISWIATGTLDVVSYATGEVVPSGMIKKVQHLEGGIVKEVLVHEGSTVKNEQPLVILESTRILADETELETRLTALSIRIQRLTNEISSSKKLKISPQLLTLAPNIAADEIGLFNIRQKRLHDQLTVQQEFIQQRIDQGNEIKARIQSASKAMTLVAEQIDISKEMLRNAISNRMTHINLLKESSELAGKIEENRSILLKTMASQREAQARISMIKNIFEEEARNELNEAEQNKRELTQRILKVKDSLARTTLRSPVDGIIKTITINTRGAVVPPGGTVLEVVPGNDQLVIEAKLPAQDIGYVILGQTVQVRLATLDSSRFGIISGSIIHISPDSTITKQGASYYKIRIKTKRDFFQSGTLHYRLSPGVEVLCSIQTGKRTVLNYFLEPFIGGIGTALTER